MDIPVIGVEEWLNAHERDAVWDLAQSTIASLTMEELAALDGDGDGLFEALGSRVMNYGWIEGSPDFKDAVASLYEREIPHGNILQANGCTGANLNALMAVVRPEDHVVAEWPTYAPLYEIPRALGAEVDYWPIHEHLGWMPDLNELERLVRPDTRLICLNNASNPVGAVLDGEMLEAVADIASRSGAYVLCDEVYLPLEGDGAYRSMADVYERAIVTNSVSKTYSVPAARCGWVIADDDVSDAIRTMRDYTMISGGVFSDLLGTYVLRHREQIWERNRAIVRRNRSLVQSWIDGQPRVSWIPPRGVSTSYIRLDIPEDDEAFCLGLLERRGVLLVPGSRFGLPCGARLGYCTRPEVLLRGLELLGEALAEF